MPEYLDLSHHFSVSGLRTGISLKQFPYLSPQDRLQLASILGLSTKGLVFPVQIHSNNVALCESPGLISDTDGIISNRPDLVMSIQVADCIPVFIVDPVERIHGLVHAGWRGIVTGIIDNTIQTIFKLSNNLEHLSILLGPSIRQCCYEIRSEIADQFNPQYVRYDDRNRIFVDLQGIVFIQLIELGVSEDNIMDLKQCTHCNSDLFHSYRRDNSAAGRMIAVIGWE